LFVARVTPTLRQLVICPRRSRKMADMKKGKTRQSQPISRTVRVARVTALAERTFGDRAKARRWLRKPKRELAGSTPLAHLARKSGARRIEDMLYRIDNGILS
jgi:putative toxin-antitoxin system antitoxin component (TIGR02293 family)